MAPNEPPAKPTPNRAPGGKHEKQASKDTSVVPPVKDENEAPTAITGQEITSGFGFGLSTPNASTPPVVFSQGFKPQSLTFSTNTFSQEFGSAAPFNFISDALAVPRPFGSLPSTLAQGPSNVSSLFPLNPENSLSFGQVGSQPSFGAPSSFGPVPASATPAAKRARLHEAFTSGTPPPDTPARYTPDSLADDEVLELCQILKNALGPDCPQGKVFSDRAENFYSAIFRNWNSRLSPSVDTTHGPLKSGMVYNITTNPGFVPPYYRAELKFRHYPRLVEHCVTFVEAKDPSTAQASASGTQSMASQTSDTSSQPLMDAAPSINQPSSSPNITTEAATDGRPSEQPGVSNHGLAPALPKAAAALQVPKSAQDLQDKQSQVMHQLVAKLRENCRTRFQNHAVLLGRRFLADRAERSKSLADRGKAAFEEQALMMKIMMSYLVNQPEEEMEFRKQMFAF